MARSAKRRPALATFRHPVRFEVRRPEFQSLASVSQLDIPKLERAARAEIELGYFRTGDCRQLVRAIVRKGMVTELVLDPCSDRKVEGAPPELVRLLNAARRRAARAAGNPVRFPIPISDFLGTSAVARIRSITCLEICAFGWWCFYCCNRPNDPHDWICGRNIIIEDTF